MKKPLPEQFSKNFPKSVKKTEDPPKDSPKTLEKVDRVEDPPKALNNEVNPYLIFIVAAGIIAFVFKLLLASRTTGNGDVLSFEMFANVAKQYGGASLFKQLAWWNHPPMMAHLMNLLGFIESNFGIAFRFTFRFVSIIADIGSLFLAYKILKPKCRKSALGLVLFAFAPAAIMLSGFHGNTDPMMIFFLLLTVYFLDIKQEELSALLPKAINDIFQTYELNNYHLAGAAFGLAANVKVVPILLVPCLFFYLPDNKRRLEFFFTAATFWVISSLPYIFQCPIEVFKTVLGYNSFYGGWGVSRLLLEYFPYDHWTNSFWMALGKYVVLGLIGLASVWMNLHGKKVPIFQQIGLVFSIFLILSPGFNVHYLFWLTPWVIALGLALQTIYYLETGLFLFLAYNWWAAGLPWDLSSPSGGDWKSTIILDYEILAWLTVILVFFVYLIKMLVEKEVSLEKYLIPLKQKRLPAALAIFVLLITGAKAFKDVVWGYGPHLYSVQGETLEIRQKKLLEMTHMSIGFFYLRSNFFKESIETYNKVVALNPTNADAYNNLCVSYMSLKEWDKAIEAGNKALEIRPDFQLVKNNIAWVTSQKNAKP
ncbi:MAG: tetratricopeptide repeat protein [Acidobacteria bacterium]|nr:tetratricopeptide repeat protein [Acidobacteriota bacterium]